MATFQLSFQSEENVVVRRDQVRRIGWVIKTMESQVGQFLLGCKWPVSGGIVVQEQDRLIELAVAFLLHNVLQLHQQRWVILRVDSLALWKIINVEDAVLIPKNLCEKFFSRFLQSEYLGGVSRYASTPLIVALSPGHSDITRFRPRSPIAPNRKSFWSRRKNSKFSQTNGAVDVFDPRSGIWDPPGGELPHVQIFMNDGPNPLTW